MQPTLREGEFVLVRAQSKAKPGDIVLCKHPFNKNVLMLKRVHSAGPSGVFIVGDAPSQSTDSRGFGILPWTHIMGVVTGRMS